MQPMHNIPARGGIDYDESPFLAIWEVTQSCDLACKHCRAAAQPIPHPDELTHEEGKALIDQIADMHIPIFVFTGGDPLKRKDVFELIRYAAGKGVQVAVTPSATPLLTREAIFKLKEAGLVRLGISLDGSTPGDSRRLPRPAGRMGAHHSGHRVGQRSRHSDPGAHHDQPPQRARSRQPVQSVREAGHRDVECLLPGSRGTRPAGRSAERARSSSRSSARFTSSRGASTSRSRPRKRCTTAAICCSTTLKSAGWGTGHPGTGGHPHGAAYEAGAPTADAPDPHHKLGHAARERRQGIHVHLARGQRVSQRLSADPCGQHSRDAAGRDLPQRADLQGAARHQPAWKANAARASSRRSAEGRGRAPTPSPAIRWRRSPAASISRRTGIRSWSSQAETFRNGRRPDRW